MADNQTTKTDNQTTKTEGAGLASQDSKASMDLGIQQYLIKLLENETTPESVAIKNLILKRIALESDVKPARIPAPMNITQIGGYFNLMEQLNLPKLQERTLTSILGLPVQYDETALTKDIEISVLRRELENLKKEIASLKSVSE